MATIDHAISRVLGGKDRAENYRLSCHECNVFKRKQEAKMIGKAELMPIAWVNQPAPEHGYNCHIIGMVFKGKWPQIKELMDVWRAHQAQSDKEES